MAKLKIKLSKNEGARGNKTNGIENGKSSKIPTNERMGKIENFLLNRICYEINYKITFSLFITMSLRAFLHIK